MSVRDTSIDPRLLDSARKEFNVHRERDFSFPMPFYVIGNCFLLHKKRSAMDAHSREM